MRYLFKAVQDFWSSEKTYSNPHRRETLSVPLCPSAFTQSNVMKDHLRSHTGETPFECDLCGRQFTRKTGLISLSGRTTVPFQKSWRKQLANCFAFSSHSLFYHLRCFYSIFSMFCEKQFKWTTSLEVHYRVHTNERPFECHICSKRFSRSGDLKKHNRVHTGERPYRCQLCPSAFTQSNSLKSHLRTHTGETPFECDLCGKQFTRSFSMRQHKKKIHDSQTSPQWSGIDFFEWIDYTSASQK
ncbi:unnamed protein product, partial [Cyprideis torosa]